MRIFRFGVFVLVAVSAYCAFIGLWLTRVVPPPVQISHGPPADVKAVKSDLCRLAAMERRYFQTTGTYAIEAELRLNGNYTLPLTGRWPYHYSIKVPSPETFTIVAVHYGPLNHAPVAVVADPSGQVCTVTPRTNRAQDPASISDDTAPVYDCEICEPSAVH